MGCSTSSLQHSVIRPADSPQVWKFGGGEVMPSLPCCQIPKPVRSTKPGMLDPVPNPNIQSWPGATLGPRAQPQCGELGGGGTRSLQVPRSNPSMFGVRVQCYDCGTQPWHCRQGEVSAGPQGLIQPTDRSCTIHLACRAKRLIPLL